MLVAHWNSRFRTLLNIVRNLWEFLRFSVSFSIALPRSPAFFLVLLVVPHRSTAHHLQSSNQRSGVCDQRFIYKPKVFLNFEWSTSASQSYSELRELLRAPRLPKRFVVWLCEIYREPSRVLNANQFKTSRCSIFEKYTLIN